MNINSLTFYNCEPSVINTSDYSMILNAEIHWVSNNYDSRLAIIKHLVDNEQLDNIIIEDNYAIGYLLNKYVNSYDTIGLKNLFSVYREWEYYRDLEDPGSNIQYDYYSKVAQILKENNKKINIIGIDVNHYNTYSPFILAFKNIIEENKKLRNSLTKSILYVNSLSNKTSISKSHFKKWYRIVKKEIKRNGIKHNSLNELVNNAKQCIISAYFWREWRWREKVMYQNIRRLCSPLTKTYGQFGLPHVTLNKVIRFKSFANLLNEEDRWKGKILSIGLVCQDCRMGNFRAHTEYRPFLKPEEFDSILPLVDKVEHLGIIDLRKVPDVKSNNVQLLLIFKSSFYRE